MPISPEIAIVSPAIQESGAKCENYNQFVADLIKVVRSSSRDESATSSRNTSTPRPSDDAECATTLIKLESWCTKRRSTGVVSLTLSPEQKARMSHLESLVAEYLEWQGYLVRRNTKVGRLAHGGWEMELDIVGYHPKDQKLIHYEPSIDALSWDMREARYLKKFNAGRKYILQEMFSWLPPEISISQIAIFVSRPKGRDSIAGGSIISIDEFMTEVRAKVVACGRMASNAISEQFPLLRTLQLSHAGYYKVCGEV